jgi:hypothetical protein
MMERGPIGRRNAAAKRNETTVRDMMHHKMNRALGRVSVGIVCGWMTACAGGDTPARNSALEGFLSSEFGRGTVGATGGSSSGNGGSGNSGSGNNGGSTSGSGNNGGSDSGSGGSDAETGGTGGDDEPSGGSGGGGGGDCDGFQILSENCGTSGCHGSGAVFTDFVASMAAVDQWVDEESAMGCGSPAKVFDTENPAASLVITKLSASPPCGGQMPITNPGSITEDQIDCIQQFIEGL